METRRERPSPASQAPNVRRTINRWALNWGGSPRAQTIRAVSVRIIASKDKRDIRRCLR